MPITVAAPPPKSASTSSPRQTQSAARQQKAVADKAAELRALRTMGAASILGLSAGILNMLGQTADAGAIYTVAEPLSEGMATLADSYESVARGLDYLAKLGPVTAIAEPLMRLGAQIAVNHKWIKATSVAGMGVVSKESMEAQVKTAMMRQEMEAQRVLMENERALAQQRAEYESMMHDMNNTDIPSPEDVLVG